MTAGRVADSWGARTNRLYFLSGYRVAIDAFSDWHSLRSLERQRNSLLTPLRQKGVVGSKANP